jgi:hypothetical protein
MVRKIGTSRRYEAEPAGLRAITALVVLREKVIRPLLAASQQPDSQTKPNHPTPVDHHYGSPQELVKTSKYRRFREMAFLGTLGS